MTLRKTSALFSIHPKYVDKILSGDKTIELRKQCSISSLVNKKMLIYSTSPVKSLVGEAYISNVQKMDIESLWIKHASDFCVNRSHFLEYFKDRDSGYAIFLEHVKKFENNISLETLRKIGITPPQSYCYIEESKLPLRKV